MRITPEETLFDRLGRRLDPLWLLVSLLASFLLCSFAGERLLKEDIYGDSFVRMQGPETYFYPPLSLLVAHVEAQLDPQKEIAVIVGGSSVMFGIAQGPEQVWTRALQAQLGPRYKVFNFAMRAGSTQDIAAHVAEVLLRRGIRTLYVADQYPLPNNDPLGKHSASSFWFGHYTKWLEAYPERLNFVLAAKDTNEARLRGFINSQVYSDDLWGFVAFKHFFTAWNAYNEKRKESLWSPIRKIADEEEELYIFPVPQRFTNYSLERELEILSAPARWLCDSGAREEQKQKLKATVTRTALWFPPMLRKSTLLVLNFDALYFRERLSPRLQQCYAEVMGLSRNLLEDAGLNAVTAGENYALADHNDRVHLTASGGAKLAEHLGLKIRELGERLYGVAR
jgi:hypothetical protein